MGGSSVNARKGAPAVKCPTYPTGTSTKMECIFMMSVMRDSGDAATMTPRWNATPSGRRVFHSKGKEETDGRMKRRRLLHDLSLLRVWFLRRSLPVRGFT